MLFDKDIVKKKTEKFWDAYFALLDQIKEDKGKFVDDIPPTREIPIDENYILGAYRGINLYVWSNRDEDHVDWQTPMGGYGRTGVRLLKEYLLDELDNYEDP